MSAHGLKGMVDDAKMRVLRTVPEFDGLDDEVLERLGLILDLQMYPRPAIGGVIGRLRKRFAKATELMSPESGGRPIERDPDPDVIHGPRQTKDTLSLAIIADGRVRLIQHEDTRTVERSLGPGTLFGEQGVAARAGEKWIRIDAQPVGRAWIMEAHPKDVDDLLKDYPELQARILRGFEAARVAPDAVDALKQAPELASARLDHLYALAEGAEIRSASQGETLPFLVDGKPPAALCLPLDGHVAYRPAKGGEKHRPIGGVPVLGLDELVRGELVRGSFIAQDQLQYMVIPARRFEELLVRVPEFLRAVRDSAKVDPLKGRSETDGRRAGAEVLLMLDEPGLDIPLGAVTSLVGTAIATHLYDRVCVLHVVGAQADASDAAPMRVPIQDDRYRDYHAPAKIMHRWVVMSPDDDKALETIDAAVDAALAERKLGEYRYDVVLIDASGVARGTTGDQKPAAPDPALELAELSSLTRVAYLHRDPEYLLPPSLLGGRVEVVPVGILGPRRDLYPLGEIMLDVDPGEEAGLTKRFGRFVTSARHYSNTRARRVEEGMERIAKSLRSRRGPFEIGDETVGRMSPWSPRTTRLRLEPSTAKALADAKAPKDVDFYELDSTFRESLNRLARALTGRRVGLALGGGGAFGYVHAALIKKLSSDEYRIPIDLLSGSSFGTVVGTYYAAGDTDFERLRAHHYFMTAAVSVGLVTTSGMTTAIDLDLGEYDLNELDISLFPIVTNADTGQEGAIRRGTIGYGVRASGSLPPFAPTIQGQNRFLDGGLAANVPVQVLADEGAGLIISSNPIPDPEPRPPKPPLPIPGVGAFLRSSDPRDRFMDGIRSTLILMRAASSSQERFAHVRYMATTRKTTMFQFGNVDEIMQSAVDDPEERLLRAVEESVEQWRARLNHPPARIRANEDGYLDVPPGVRFQEVGGRVQRTKIADRVLEELARFLVQRSDLQTIEIQVCPEAVDLETPGDEERAEQAAELIRDALVKGQVAKQRLRTRLVPKSERHDRGVNFKILAHRERGAEDAQLEIRRARLVAGARASLRDDHSRLARLLSLEAARPELSPDNRLAPDSEAVLRDVLDVPVRRLYTLDAGDQLLVAATFSPDGAWLAMAGGGGPSLVRIHDARDPRRYVELPMGASDGQVLSLAWSSDGTRLAATGHMTPRLIWVWDTSALEENLEVRELARLDPKNWDVWGVEFSPDGRRVLGTDLSAGEPPAVGLWTSLDAPAIRLPHDGRIAQAGFSPDGRWVASAGEDGKVGLWDATTGARRAWLVDGDTPARTLAWSDDGTRLAAGVGRDVLVWLDPTSDAPPIELTGHLRWVTCLAWSPDGQMLASGARDRAVRLWHVERAKLHTVLGGHAGSVSRVQFHRKRAAIASCANDRAYVWSTISGDLQAIIADHGGQVNALDWRGDGTELVTAAEGRVFVHDPYARGSVRLEVPSDGLSDVGYDPADGGSAILATAEGGVERWDPENGARQAVLHDPTERPSRARWHPEGGKLAMLVDTDVDRPRLRIVDRDGKVQVEAPLPNVRLRDAAWSPDGRRLFVVLEGQFMVYAYDGQTLELASEIVEVSVSTFAWAPDSRRIAVTRWVLGSCVDVWDVTQPWASRSPRASSSDAAWSVAWSSDGRRLVSAHNDGAVLFFEEDPANVARPPDFDGRQDVGHKTAAHIAAFQPGSYRLAVGVGSKIVCYDLATGYAPLGEALLGHVGAVRRLAWTPNGKRLASGGDDGRVFLWDPVGGRPSVRLQGYRDSVAGLDWRGDGRRLISWAADANARVHLSHPKDVVEAAGSAAGSNELSQAEWDKWLVGAGPRRPTWPFDATPFANDHED